MLKKVTNTVHKQVRNYQSFNLGPLNNLFNTQRNYWKGPVLFSGCCRDFCSSNRRKVPNTRVTKKTINEISKLLHQGEVYVGVLNFKEAHKKYEQALELSNNTADSVCVQKATSLHKLGDLYQIEGNFQRSLEYYLQAMNIFLQNYTANERSIIDLQRSIGLLYKHTERYQESIDYLIQATEGQCRSENYDQAQNCIKFAMEIIDKNIAHVESGLRERVLVLAADVSIHVRNLPRAREMLNLLHHDNSKQFGSSNQAVVNILEGFLCFRQGDIEMASSKLRKGVVSTAPYKAKNLLLFARGFAALGCIEEISENHTEALNQFKASQELFSKLLESERDVRYCKVLSYLGNTYFYLNQNDQAMEHYLESIKIASSISIQDYEFLAILYNNTAILYNLTSRDMEAITYFQKALECRLKSEKEDSLIDQAILHKRIGISYLNMMKLEKAGDYLEKAYTLFEKEYGKDHDETIKVQLMIREIYNQNGQLQKLEAA